ncbi:uncharacterized protein LACBIDRAFT_298005 [Laccaria bicolor S238N-H82]|uniref:Predicted protein n=1 Tax=Laccaria bicolor (strain S238N-H82 / ATCC MYA-4686) TaxID=486041 RepID=B0DC19_LACBS|nr:uncharacterized protein LACBIDRAFT_298005 [Laccaria bicolor S238N-H82]EDR07656.1 predicted protein [Laccaria bicolor S238N-H82]|eukprot:XP_001881445.1 predicted protein [Laccaria bicolor S238N-H82]
MRRVRQKREEKAQKVEDSPDISEEEGYDIEAESQSDSEEDSGSEYGGGAKSKAARPAKRPRLSKAAEKKPTRSLSLLPKMPLDVLFEVLLIYPPPHSSIPSPTPFCQIFGRLAPKDFINVSRTNKLFRQTLMSRSATTVWNTSLNGVGSPSCPSDISGPRWAILLFMTHCQECGTKGVPRVDFALRRRVCTNCKKAHLFVSSKFNSRFPDLEKSILDLLPYTSVGGWSHGHSTSSKFYWDTDIQAMNIMLAKFHHDIHMRVPGAKKKLDEFIEDRKAHVIEVLKYASICVDWTAKMATQRSNDLMQAKTRREAQIRARLLGLGYLEVDVNSISLWHEQKATELNDRSWVRLRPELEQLVQERRDSRLLSERKALVNSRKKIVEELYNAYRKTLVPLQLPSYPRVSDICRTPEFSQHIEAESTVDITAASFSGVMNQLPGIIIQWIESKKAGLRTLLTEAQSTLIGTPASAEAPSRLSLTRDVPPLDEVIGTRRHVPTSAHPPAPPQSSESADILNLATAVFSCGSIGTACSSSKLFIGWPEASTHHCRGYYAHHEEPQTKLQVRRAAATAASIVKAAGLPVLFTTASEMDERNLRFMCAACPARHHAKNVYGKPVFTWRSAITHVSLGHGEPTWEVLNVKQTQTIKQKELVNDIGALAQGACWSCNRCSDFVDDMKTKAVVIEHLKAIHDVALPAEPEDLFVMDFGKLTQCLPAIYDMTPPPTQSGAPTKNVRCTHCGVSTKRLFDEGGVRCHIKAKHNVMNPIKGTDWVNVIPGALN